MIDSIISWSCKNRVVVVVVTAIITLFSLAVLQKIKLDALPDLTPPQVVLQVEFPNQSPKIIEEQIVYPLTRNLLAIANVDSVRAMSGYENALIYVIFKDKTELYWARSRILEQLNQVQNLPSNAKISLGNDSTSVGWAYQYILKSETKDLGELRSLQDFYYKYALLGIDGVSEVASIGGFIRDYEITLDNDKIVRYDLKISEIIDAIKLANNERGGGVSLDSGFEKIIRVNGYVQNEHDIENLIIKQVGDVPLTIGDVGVVTLKPAPRRGAAELDGKGEVVGGIVMVKYGGNTYETLQKIKQKVSTLNASFMGNSKNGNLDSKKLKNIESSFQDSNNIIESNLQNTQDSKNKDSINSQDSKNAKDSKNNANSQDNFPLDSMSHPYPPTENLKENYPANLQSNQNTEYTNLDSKKLGNIESKNAKDSIESSFQDSNNVIESNLQNMVDSKNKDSIDSKNNANSPFESALDSMSHPYPPAENLKKNYPANLQTNQNTESSNLDSKKLENIESKNNVDSIDSNSQEKSHKSHSLQSILAQPPFFKTERSEIFATSPIANKNNENTESTNLDSKILQNIESNVQNLDSKKLDNLEYNYAKDSKDYNQNIESNNLNAAHRPIIENDSVIIEPVYDRSELILSAVLNLLKTLFEECVIVLIVCVVFLLHFRSALIIMITLPLCVLFTFLLMWVFDIESSIMSLGGIAIAIGAMVDAAIVMIENAHRNLASRAKLDSINSQDSIDSNSQEKSHKSHSLQSIPKEPPFFKTERSDICAISFVANKDNENTESTNLDSKKLENIESNNTKDSNHNIESNHLSPAHRPTINKSTESTRQSIILQSAKQVGSPIFFALIIIVVSFLPIFALSGQEERLFSPLAYTKTFAMLIGAMLSITIVPILMLFFIKGNIKSENQNPINRICINIYKIALEKALNFKYIFLAICLFSVPFFYFIYKNLSWEFMPKINEGVLMYMPVSNASPNIETSVAYLKKVDSIIMSFDEVESVFGKAGRANTSSDSAPLSMLEVYIHLKPREMWKDKSQTNEQLRDKLESALQIEGLTNSWTYPIRGRTDMLLTGIRTPLGLKLYGNDRATLERLSIEIESRLKGLNESLSVFAERANAGYYIDINFEDSKLARYGISRGEIMDFVGFAVGGSEISRMIKGVESYPISVRLDSVSREDIESLREIYVKTASGFYPLGELCEITLSHGASELKSEKGLGVNYIYITPRQGVSSGDYKAAALKALQGLELPSGYYYEFSGESEYLQKAMDTLSYIVPFSLLLIFVLIFLALKNLSYAILCFATLPFAICGGILGIDLMGYNLNIAGIVGLLALLGIASETSIVMLLYLEQSFKSMILDSKNSKRVIARGGEAIHKNIESFSLNALKEAVIFGAAKRVRPKLMTVFSIIASLIPIMYSSGVGSEIMKAIATPMLFGMISSTILTLFIIPLCFFILKARH